jgi:hypothetical protein
MTSPWKNMNSSAGAEHSTALRVDASHPWDLFWAVGCDGQPQLACRLPEETAFPDPYDIPRVRAVDVRLARLSPWCWCVVELQDRAFEDIFHSLCRALVEATRPVQSADGVMPVLLRHIARWQRMLGKAAIPGRLTLQEQIGLVGELLFLRDHVLAEIPLHDAIATWVAPQGHPQDFMIPGGMAIEVKCRQATAPDMVHISSQWQLHQDVLQLYLTVFTLGQCDRDKGFSLHSLVQELRGRFDSSMTSRDEFEMALVERGYLDDPDEYDKRWWTGNGLRCFSVQGSFPRLEPDCLPAGVIEVSYTISLPECEPWAAGMDMIFQ